MRPAAVWGSSLAISWAMACGCKSDLNKFLVAMILQRAVTGGKVDDGLAIPKQLHLPVQRARQIQFQQYPFAGIGFCRSTLPSPTRFY